jgi:hypothetical protein
MWYKTHDLLVKALALATVALMLVFVAILPIYQNANKVLGKIKTKNKELDTISNKVAILSKLDKNILSDRVATMDAAIPPKKDVLLYLTSIDGLSRELGLTLGGISLTPGTVSEDSGTESKIENTKGLQSLETDIKIQGGRENIYTFLRTIENVLPLMQIKDIKVDSGEGDKYSLSLTLGMLWASREVSSVTGVVTLFGEEEDKYFTQLAGFRRFEKLPTLSAPGAGEIKKDLFAPSEN